MSGPLLTKTLLVGALSRGGTKGGPKLVARDKTSGKEVDRPARRRNRHADDVSVGGKQYIALTVGASPVPELVAFALP